MNVTREICEAKVEERFQVLVKEAVKDLNESINEYVAGGRWSIMFCPYSHTYGDFEEMMAVAIALIFRARGFDTELMFNKLSNSRSVVISWYNNDTSNMSSSFKGGVL